MRPVREKTEQLLVWTAALAFVQMLVAAIAGRGAATPCWLGSLRREASRAQQRTWQETRGLRAPHGVFFLLHAAAGRHRAPRRHPRASTTASGPRSRAMMPALM